jgi:hypothetical protein
MKEVQLFRDNNEKGHKSTTSSYQMIILANCTHSDKEEKWIDHILKDSMCPWFSNSETLLLL